MRATVWRSIHGILNQSHPSGLFGSCDHCPTREPAWQASRTSFQMNVTVPTLNTLTIDDCRSLIDDGMHRVDELIRARLSSDVVLINQLAGYIVGSGGKRLRPQLVLLSAGACGLDSSQPPERTRHSITVAAIIEFIHTATLLHDDVVDASDMRRGQDTANAVWGNEAAVLVGDFLYSRAFEMMVDVQRMEVMGILASTTNRIAEGEVMQLLNVREPDLTEAQYVEVIEAKTARLFQAATHLGALLADQDEATCQAMGRYGQNLGTAFQIADDVLDYRSDSDTMGKNVGDDLAEGKTTLPLIYAMRDGTEQQRHVIAQCIREASVEELPKVMSIIEDTNALQKSIDRASESANLAIEALESVPASKFRDALERIALYSIERSH